MTPRWVSPAWARACALAMLAFGVSSGADFRLHRVRLTPQNNSARLILETDSEVTFTAGRLTRPNRVYFDLENTAPAGAKSQTIEGRGLVERVRIAVTRKATTRIVLDLATEAEFETLRQSKPHQLIIDVRREGAPPAAESRPPLVTEARSPETKSSEAKQVEARALPQRKRPKAFVPPPPLVFPPTPLIDPPKLALYRPPRDVTVLRNPLAFTMPRVLPPVKKQKAVLASTPKNSKKPKTGPPALAAKIEQRRPEAEPIDSPIASLGEPAKDAATLTRALGLKLRRVVLDAGHGGKDVGTISPHGLYEKDLVLDVTRRLGQLIEERLGSEVVYTREDDTFIPLQERTAIANREHADLFLSIHANSSRAESVSGFETYYLNFSAAKADMDVAARENAASDKTIADLSDLVKQITLNEKLDESREFASHVHDATNALAAKANGRFRDRGIKKAPFVVLIGARMPSVLVEIGFLTNPGEEAQMKKSEYRQKIADALFQGVSGYADTLSHYTASKPPVSSEVGN